MKTSFLSSKSIFAAVLVMLSCAVVAREAVIVTLTGGSNGPQSFTSISDAVDSLREDPATTYGNVNFTLGNTYGGSFDILGFQLTIGVSITGTVTYSFTDIDGNLVTGNLANFDSFEDFLQSGTDQANFGKFIEAMQENAIFNYISGSNSPVSQSVRDNTMRAMGPSLTQRERSLRAKSGEGGGSFSIGGEYTKFSTEEFDGESYNVPIQIGGRLGKFMNFDFRIPLNYLELEGSEFYRFGLEFDLGFVILGHAPTDPIEWEIRPTVGNYLLGTADLMNGGDIYNYGVQNRLQANVGPVSVALGSYYGVYKSADISLGEMNVDLNVDTTIISHGLKVMYRLGMNLVVELYGINSRPEDGEGFREIETIGGAVNFKLNPMSQTGAIIRVGYSQDEGKDTENSDYEAERIEASLMFRF